MLSRIICLTFFIFLTHIASAQYKYYCNARYDYCIQYPKNFDGLGEADNGDGQVFVSKDKKANITAFASIILEDINTLAIRYNDIIKSHQVTYKVYKKDYFIVSGYTAKGMIFYIKVKADYPKGVLYILEFTYPKEQLNLYNEYCKIIAKSF